MSQEIFYRHKKNILEFAYHEDGKIRLSLSESRGQGLLAFYQETEVAIERIDGLVREINHYLNKINLLKNEDQYLLSELQKSCQLPQVHRTKLFERIQQVCRLLDAYGEEKTLSP